MPEIPIDTNEDPPKYIDTPLELLTETYNDLSEANHLLSGASYNTWFYLEESMVALCRDIDANPMYYTGDLRKNCKDMVTALNFLNFALSHLEKGLTQNIRGETDAGTP